MENSTSHTQDRQPWTLPPSPLNCVPGWGLSTECRTHTVESHFLRSELPSRIPASADIHCRGKDQSDGSNLVEGDQSQSSPWAPPVTMALRKTCSHVLAYGAPWDPHIDTQPNQLSPDPCSRDPDSRDPGEPVPGWVWPSQQSRQGASISHVPKSQGHLNCHQPELSSRATSDQGQSLVLHLRLCKESTGHDSSFIVGHSLHCPDLPI